MFNSIPSDVVGTFVFAMFSAAMSVHLLNGEKLLFDRSVGDKLVCLTLNPGNMLIYVTMAFMLRFHGFNMQFGYCLLGALLGELLVWALAIGLQRFNKRRAL